MWAKECKFFDGFGEEELRRLEAISFIKNYNAGDIIFFEGESSKFLHILLSGSVEIVKANPKLGELYLHSLAAPSMIAELPTFEESPYPATARAVTDSKVAKIDFSVFKDMLLSNPDTSYRFIKSLIQKIKILEGFIQKELYMSADKKVLELLRVQHDIFEKQKHIEIAKKLNMTPETLSRSIKKLKEEDAVTVVGKVVKLKS